MAQSRSEKSTISAGSYHGYGIHHFLHAEPRFADDPTRADDELRALVDAAHAEGLYVIFDIVLNHTADVFAYQCDPSDTTCTSSNGAEASFHPSIQTVHWRDGKGMAHSDWTDIGALANPTTDALVWPKELQRNAFFRRQGGASPQDDTIGDFASLKQIRHRPRIPEPPHQGIPVYHSSIQHSGRVWSSTRCAI